MINTDASGQGSLQYGKTSDHVLALRSVLMNGEILDTSAVKSDDVLENYPLAENGKTLHQTIFQRCKEKARLNHSRFTTTQSLSHRLRS